MYHIQHSGPGDENDSDTVMNVSDGQNGHDDGEDEGQGGDGGDDGEGDDGEGEQETPEQKAQREAVERGDVVDPEVTLENAEAVAGEGEQQGAAGKDGITGPNKGKGGDAGKQPRSRYVTRDRFDEVNDKQIALAEENARLRQQLESGGGNRQQQGNGAADQGKGGKDGAAKFDVDAKEEEYAQALIEGDTKKAATIRKEINAHIRAEAEESAVSRSRSESAAVRAQDALNEAAEEAFEKYPFLNDSDKVNANAEAIQDVKDWRDVFIQRGMKPHVALRKAVEKVGPIYEAELEAADLEGADDGADDGKNGGKGAANGKGGKDDLAAQRQKNALKRNAAAAQQQPPVRQPGIGNRSQAAAVDVGAMSESQFRKLPESEKAKLRGDTV